MFLIPVFLFFSSVTSRNEPHRNPFGLGIGAGLGVGKHLENDGGSDVSFINVAVAQARAFWILGVDYEYNLGRSSELSGEGKPGEFNFHAKMRLSVLLYSFSFEGSAFYLKGGIGSAKLAQIFSLAAPGESYHFGIGAEINLDRHIVLDFSFLTVFPGVGSIAQRSLQLLEVPRLSSFFNLRNHEFVARFMIFL